MSISFHAILHNALKLPARVVVLRLDISGGQFIGSGLLHVANALAAVSNTLRELCLGIAYMGLRDVEFVQLCDHGLANLKHMHSFLLDASHNSFTNAGVHALEHTMPCTVRMLTLDFSWNFEITEFHLHRVHGLQYLRVDVANTCAISFQFPADVFDISMDLRNIECNSPIIMAPIRMSSGSLNMLLDSSTASALQQVPVVVGGRKLDLVLELTDMEPRWLHHRISDYGNANMIQTIRMRNTGTTPTALNLIPMTLSCCKSLQALQLELYMSMPVVSVFEVLQTVSRDLVHLVRFHVLIGADGPPVDVHTISPCTQFGYKESVLRNLCLDFQGPPLTDFAVSLLVYVAAERRRHSQSNVTTLRIQGSSVGFHSLHALSLSAGLTGCSFHFFPPMSPAVNNIRLLCSSM
jgi:hypothetical protein